MYKLPVAASGQPAAAAAVAVVAAAVVVAAVATIGVSRFRSASRVNESSPSPLVKCERREKKLVSFKTLRSFRERDFRQYFYIE